MDDHIETFSVPQEQLTEFEQAVASGESLDQFKIKLPDSVVAKAKEALQQKRSTSEPQVGVTLPDKVSIEDLPEDKQKEVFSFLDSISVDNVSDEVPEEPEQSDDSFAFLNPAENQVETEVVSTSSMETPETIETTKEVETGEPKVVVTDDDRTHYLRCIMGGKPFFKTYMLFNGNLPVTFRTRTMKESTLISEQIIKETDEGILPSQPETLAGFTRFFRERRLALGMSLVDVNNVKNGPQPGDSNYAEDLETRGVHKITESRVENFTQDVFNVILSQYGIFESLVQKLAKEALDPNF